MTMKMHADLDHLASYIELLSSGIILIVVHSELITSLSGFDADSNSSVKIVQWIRIPFRFIS